MRNQPDRIVLVVLGMDIVSSAASIADLPEWDKRLLAEQTANSIVALEEMGAVFPIIVPMDSEHSISEMIAERNRGLEALGMDIESEVKAARLRLEQQVNVSALKQALLHLGGI